MNEGSFRAEGKLSIDFQGKSQKEEKSLSINFLFFILK